MDNSIQKLAEIFIRFPGIGPKQARRFVFFLLKQDTASLSRLASAITELKKSIGRCEQCFRYFPLIDGRLVKICELCQAGASDDSQLLVLEKDVDLDKVRKSGVYHGRYFVLGGLIPILEKNPEQKVRIKELERIITERMNKGLKEVILGLSANPEGDNTADYLKNRLAPLLPGGQAKLSLLGRGLSTGTELEYIDTDTFKGALENRH